MTVEEVIDSVIDEVPGIVDAVEQVTKSPDEPAADAPIPGVTAEGLLDVWHLVQSGKLGALWKLYKDYENKVPLEQVAVDIGALLDMLGVEGLTDELQAFAVAIKGKDPMIIAREAMALAVAVIDQLKVNPPAGVLSMAAEPPLRIDDMNIVEARTWLASRRADIKDAADRPIVKVIFRNHPEMLDLLSGRMTAVQAASIDPATVDKLIKFIDNFAIPALSVAATFVPYLIPVVIALKFISMRYHTNHPQGDRGLALEDFGV